MTKSNSVGVSRTAPPPAPDPLEQLLDAEASLADEYERAHDDARRCVSDARERAETIARDAAERAVAERRRIAERLEDERARALASLAAETARGTATFALDDARTAALAAEVVEELLEQLRLEARP
ncbi:MAG TPA: hypothetical protein VGD77_11200 [Gemmatimonadaceae bacterium]